MLKGRAKTEYQRKYMKEWQRRRRSGLNKTEVKKPEGLNIRSKQGLNIQLKSNKDIVSALAGDGFPLEEVFVAKVQFDADGNEIPDL
jgi:hypothetical protein